VLVLRAVLDGIMVLSPLPPSVVDGVVAGDCDDAVVVVAAAELVGALLEVNGSVGVSLDVESVTLAIVKLPLPLPLPLPESSSGEVLVEDMTIVDGRGVMVATPCDVDAMGTVVNASSPLPLPLPS